MLNIYMKSLRDIWELRAFIIIIIMHFMKISPQTTLAAVKDHLGVTSARKSTLEGGSGTNKNSLILFRIPLSNGFLEPT